VIGIAFPFKGHGMRRADILVINPATIAVQRARGENWNT
jgi:hypothetical protein